MTFLNGHWLSYDRMLELEPGKSARAIRNVPNTLAIFDSHFPRQETMPGVLILGTMGKVAKALVEAEGGVWRLAGGGAIGFRHWVGPGDTMEISVTLKSRDDSEAILSGDVKVDGKLVTRARKLRMVPE
jgi:3-hydroxyacyl-[acyl-carrier-protein] dehydratase